jgi:uncharacterized protein (TIGR02001 family)
MKTLKLALAAALTMPAMSVFAEEEKSDHSVSYNMGLFSEYVFRGYTQTHNDPALQGGIDYEHSSGFYLGAWASNISWLRDANQSDSGHSLEVDVYGGYAGEIADTGIGYDVGLLQYFYPGEMKSNQAAANTLEYYVGLNYGTKFGDFSVTRYEVLSNDAWTWGDRTGSYTHSAKGSDYWSVDYEHDIGQYIPSEIFKDVTLSLHYGKQRFNNYSEYDYVDTLVGIDKAYKGVNVGVQFIGTNMSKSTWTKVGSNQPGESRTVFYVSKEF